MTYPSALTEKAAITAATGIMRVNRDNIASLQTIGELLLEEDRLMAGRGDGRLILTFKKTVSFLKVAKRLTSDNSGRLIRFHYQYGPHNDFTDAQTIPVGYADGAHHIYFFKFDPAIRNLAYLTCDECGSLGIDELKFVRLGRITYYCQKLCYFAFYLAKLGYCHRGRFMDVLQQIKKGGIRTILRKIKARIFSYGLPDMSDLPDIGDPSAQRLKRRYHFLDHSGVAIVGSVQSSSKAMAPRFTVIVLVENGATPEALRSTLASIVHTSYPNYEIVVGSGCENSEVLRAAAVETVGRNLSFQTVPGAAPASILDAFLQQIDSDYFIVLLAGDQLTEKTLPLMAKAAQDGAHIIYTDHDHITPGGAYAHPAFKPDFDEERLYSHDYFSRAVAFSSKFIQGLVVCDVQLKETYLYDLLLQCLFAAKSVPIHLPHVLFHLHDPSNISTVAAKDALSAAWNERCQVLERHFKRHQRDATVRRGNFFPITHIVPMWDESPLVSIVIPFRDRADLLKSCIMSILEKTSYHRFEIVGVDNRSQTPEIKVLKEELTRDHAQVHFHDYDEAFNYSDINNRAAESWCQGEFIVLLNNDIEIISTDWIERLLDHARRPDVGAVGAKLHYPDGKLQHVGVGLGVNDLVAHLHRAYPADAPGYLLEPHCVHNVSAVTAACLMIRRTLYLEIGGMDALHLKVAFNDVDLCLRLRSRGLKIIYTPLCQAYHHESLTRKTPSTPKAKAQFQSEVAFMQHAYRRLITSGDPFYNPNLARYLNTPTADVAILTIRMKSGYGVDVVVDIQACGLVQAGYKVTVYAIDCDAERFAERPYDLVRINSGELDTFVVGLNTSPHTYIIAHSTPFFEILPRIDKRKITIAYEHGDPEPDLFEPHEREARRAIKVHKHSSVYASCNAVVAISHFIRRDIDWPDAVIIHNGADHLQARGTPENAIAPPPAFSSDKINILCVSRLGRGESNYKGYDDFITLRDLIDTNRFACVLLGTGTCADKRAIERSGIKVILNASDSELISSYLACDVFISFSKWEGFNLPVVEAQYFGKPAIALDRCSHREVTPLVFDTPAQMATFLNDCSRGDLVDYGRKAKEFIDRYSWASSVDQLRQLMYRLISEYDFYAAADDRMEAPRATARLGLPPQQYVTGRVTICILTKDKINFIKPCIESLLQYVDHRQVEIMIGDTGSTDPAVMAFYKKLPKDVRVIYLDHYHFSANNNHLAERATGQYLLFLNNDTLIRSALFPGLLLPFISEKVAVVGTRLQFPDATLQHAGAEIFTRDPYRYVGWHPYGGFPADFPEANRIKEMPGVTGAALLIRHDRFDAVGGFDESYNEECQDMDLCMKIWEAGYKVVYYPDTDIIHYENGTRTIGEDNDDRSTFRTKWAGFIDGTFFNSDTQGRDWELHVCLSPDGAAINARIARFFQDIEPIKTYLRLTIKTLDGRLRADGFSTSALQGVRYRVIKKDYEDSTKYDLHLTPTYASLRDDLNPKATDNGMSSK